MHFTYITLLIFVILNKKRNMFELFKKILHTYIYIYCMHIHTRIKEYIKRCDHA